MKTIDRHKIDDGKNPLKITPKVAPTVNLYNFIIYH
jgi:hypothetical protein